MKRYNNIYKTITNIDEIIDMYENTISKNTRNKLKIEKFDRMYSLNIAEIKKQLSAKSYIPGKYNIFLIREPKLRIIMSQEIKDKIVNHLVAKYFLIDIFDKSLIKENCATRIGMGTHYALKLFKNNYNKYKNKYKKFYILKFDISKYFYNIDHEIAKQIIRSKIKDEDALKIIFSIIDSTDELYVNDTINKLKKTEIERLKQLDIHDKNIKIEEVEKLPTYQKGKGLPIGNMSSQIIATFYLNELDHYIKEKLKIKGYVRYMDDGVIIHDNKEYLKYVKLEIEKIVNKYKLKLNKKTKIYSSNEEIEFLGFRFFKKNKKTISKVTNKTKKRFKKKVKKLYKYNEILSEEKRSVIASYLGHLGYGCCNELIYKNIKLKDR
ncbi:MAG: RNA-directed DNA polymerase [Bacilli bacterium]|nr:RNA-directed DNA polymerase [Bacilli bacterium]